jgi:hypothetical protein
MPVLSKAVDVWELLEADKSTVYSGEVIPAAEYACEAA